MRASDHALNGSVMQLLDGSAIYKVSEVTGKHLGNIEVRKNDIRLNF